jgi:hypothetical protein
MKKLLDSISILQGFSEDDYKMIIRCTCAEWSRTKLRCLHALCVLHDMGKIDIYAENASLASVGKQGRRKHRGLWHTKETDDTVDTVPHSYPSKHPEGIVKQYLYVAGYIGMGMITCKFVTICIYKHVNTYICICIYMYIYILIYIYIYIYIYINIYIYIYIY